MDRSEKRALKKYLIFLLPFLVAPIYGILVPWYKNVQRKSNESYVRMVVQALDTAERSYHQEWKTYSPSLKDIGFSIPLKDINIYTSPEEISESDKKKLKSGDYPFFKADSYQVVVKSGAGEAETFWLLDESGTLRKVKP
ncbi:MAG: hypothetical protein K0S12_1526 [Bacteroidetes bacterium]|jgi:hypothetical protein|nr:hypothetical protein [Bacteroidota bacterium]